MRIVILGGTGFIGPHVVRRLEGNDVTLFHRHPARPGSDSASHVLSDRSELPLMRRTFEALNADCLIDMMAQNKESALQGIGLVAPFAGRVVMVSSASVYRQYGKLMRLETEPVNPGPAAEGAPVRSRLFVYRHARLREPEDPCRWMDDYDKLPAEAAYLSHTDIETSILRLPMVFGPGDPDERVGRYVQMMQRGAAEICLAQSVASWRNARGYVENVAQAIALAASGGKPGRVYNIADSGDFPEAEWVERIGRAVGWNGRVTVVPDDDPAGVLPLEELPAEADFSVHLRLDTRRIRTELGFVETISVDEALRRTVASILHSPSQS